MRRLVFALVLVGACSPAPAPKPLPGGPPPEYETPRDYPPAAIGDKQPGQAPEMVPLPAAPAAPAPPAAPAGTMVPLPSATAAPAGTMVPLPSATSSPVGAPPAPPAGKKP